jgi:hypothetical protein
MTEEQKQKAIKYVEFILEPINGKFVDFEKPTVMYSCVRPMWDNSSIISEKNKLIIYHMKIKTDFGEIVMNFWSNELDDPRWNIVVGCAYNKSIIPNEEKWRKINEKIRDSYLKDIE